MTKALGIMEQAVRMLKDLLRSAAEARDDLVVITRTDEAAARSWSIAAYRLEGTRLVRTIDATHKWQKLMRYSAVKFD